MSKIESTCITAEADFLDLADEWNALAAKTDANSVFYRHEWFEAAWCWVKARAELSILKITRDNDLIGIFPLVRTAAKSGGINTVALEYLAIPDTQECEVLADAEDLDQVIDEICRWLRSSRKDWDTLQLDKFRLASGTLQRVRHAAFNAGSRAIVSYGGANAGIALSDGWDAYYARRSRRLKKGNNLIVNRLKRDEKEVSIECYDAAGDADLAALVDTITSLSANSWKAGTGLTLDNSGPQAFIRCLSKHAAAKSWLLVWVLSIDGEPAAMEYQLKFNSVVSGLRADYDTKFDQHSPGTLLNWRVIERLFDSDARIYWLGPGSNEYKARWVEESQELASLTVYSRSARGRYVWFLEACIKPVGRRLSVALQQSGTRVASQQLKAVS